MHDLSSPEFVNYGQNREKAFPSCDQRLGLNNISVFWAPTPLTFGSGARSQKISYKEEKNQQMPHCKRSDHGICGLNKD